VLDRYLLAIDRREQNVRDEQLTSLITFCDELDMPLFVLALTAFANAAYGTQLRCDLS